MMLQMASINTVLQTIVDEDKRGRVMSFFSMAFFGTIPIGSLIAGSLADRIGVQETIMLGGVPCVLGGLLFMRELPRLQHRHDGLDRPLINVYWGNTDHRFNPRGLVTILPTVGARILKRQFSVPR